jgi:hypothetical protein
VTAFANRLSLAALGAAGWVAAGWLGIAGAAALYMAFWEFVAGPLMVAFIDSRKEGGAVATDRRVYEGVRRRFDRWRRRWAWYRGAPVPADEPPNPPSGTAGATSGMTVSASPGVSLGRSEAQQGEKRNERSGLKAVPDPEEPEGR